MKNIVWLLSVLLLIGSATAASAGSKPTKASTLAKAQATKEMTTEEVPRISVDELILLMAKKKGSYVVVDVRALDAYTEKIRGALQIPFDQVETHLKEIPRNKLVVLYCA